MTKIFLLRASGARLTLRDLFPINMIPRNSTG